MKPVARNRNSVILGFLILLLPLFINMLQFDFRIAPALVNIFFAIYVLAKPKLLIRHDVKYGIVILFIFWCFISIGLFLLPYNPSNVLAFFVGINVSLIPVLAFFLALRLRWSDVSETVSMLILLHVGVCIVSIMLHFFQPDFYTAYLANQFIEVGELELWQYYARLQGPLGSTSIGVMCCSSVFLIPLTKFSNIIKGIFILIFFITVFLTFQRSSMFLIFFASFLSMQYFELKVRFIILLSIITVLSLTINIYGDSELLYRIFGRIEEIAVVLTLEDRTTYGIVFANIAEYMLGFGLGATTSVADARGYNPGGQIVDANHLRIMADLGIAGLIIFMMTWVVPVTKAIAFRRAMPLVFAISAYQLQAIGTNVFDSYYTGHLYWFYLGLLTIALAVREERLPNVSGVIHFQNRLNPI